MGRRLRFALLMVICLSVVILYWGSLRYAPFFDDLNFFERGLLDRIFLDGFSFSPRWLPYFASAWINLIFDDVMAQRAVNLGLHLATGYVLYALVRQVSMHAAPHRNNDRAAVAAAALFLLHPLAVYAVGYIIQRTLLMATLFGLLALNAYFDGLLTRKKSYFYFSALFYLLSAFSKEHAVLIPVVALALTPLVEPIALRNWRRLVWPILLFMPVSIFLVYSSQANLGRVYEPYAAAMLPGQLGGMSHAEIWVLSVMTQASLFFKYLSLMLFPFPGGMSVDLRVPFATHFGDMSYLFGSAMFLLYGGIAVYWLLKGGRMALVGFALLAPWLQFCVEFSTVRVQEPFVLYRAYLWMGPLFLLVPILTRGLTDKLFWVLWAGVALAFAWASAERLQTFSSGYALWDDAVRKLPNQDVLGAARVYSNRGYWNAKNGEFQAAIADYTNALSVDPRYKGAIRGRAFAAMRAGNLTSALDDANKLISLYPDDPGSFVLRGLVYRDQKNIRLAIEDFEYACNIQKSLSACMILNATKGRFQGAFR